MGVTLAGSERCTKAVSAFLEACANTLTSIGNVWKRSWNNGIYEKLAIDYGLCGLPLELVGFTFIFLFLYRISLCLVVPGEPTKCETFVLC